MKQGDRITKARVVTLTLVLVAVIASLAFDTGIGTPSSFGIGQFFLLCPLGGIEVLLASKALVPVTLISLGVVVAFALLFGRAWCAWGGPAPVIRRFFKRDPKVEGAGEACGANDGGYYVGFYEKTDHDNGLGGFLFMLEVFPTDYDYTELPEYQAICGLTVDGANYNLIAELPTDVQFANENADLYRSMSNDFTTILKSLTFSKGVTRTEVTAPVPQSESDT